MRSSLLLFFIPNIISIFVTGHGPSDSNCFEYVNMVCVCVVWVNMWIWYVCVCCCMSEYVNVRMWSVCVCFVWVNVLVTVCVCAFACVCNFVWSSCTCLICMSLGFDQVLSDNVKYCSTKEFKGLFKISKSFWNSQFTFPRRN